MEKEHTITAKWGRAVLIFNGGSVDLCRTHNSVVQRVLPGGARTMDRKSWKVTLHLVQESKRGG